MSETPANTLQYRSDGPEDAPVLVLGPALGATWHMWDRQAPELARHWRVLRFDLPGHGGAPAEPAPAVGDLTDRLLATLDALGVDRFGYAGCSIGGAMGADLALRHSHRLASLALIAASARFGTPDSWRQRGNTVRTSGMDPIARSAPERWFTPGFAAAQPAIVDWAVQMVATTDPGCYVAACDALAAFDVRDGLSRIGVPALVLVGAEDQVAPPADARVLVAGIHDARLAVVPGASHLAPVEQPAAVTDLLMRHFTATWRPVASGPAPGRLRPSGQGPGPSAAPGAPGHTHVSGQGPVPGEAPGHIPPSGQGPDSSSGPVQGEGPGHVTPSGSSHGQSSGRGPDLPSASVPGEIPGYGRPSGQGPGLSFPGPVPGGVASATPGHAQATGQTQGQTQGQTFGQGPARAFGPEQPSGHIPGSAATPGPAFGPYVPAPQPSAAVPADPTSPSPAAQAATASNPPGFAAQPTAAVPTSPMPAQAQGFGPPPALGPEPGADPYERGVLVRREVLGDGYTDGAEAGGDGFGAGYDEFVTRFAWGGVWDRPGLDRQTRSLLTLTALTAGGHLDQLAVHTRAALRGGVTPGEIEETLLHTAVYCGLPAADAAFVVARRVIAEESAPQP